MKKSMNVKELSARQRQVLRSLAGGSSLTEAARDCNYTVEAVCRLSKTPNAKAELLRLRAEAEMALAEALPALVRESVGILQAQLQSPLPDRRTNAAMFILRYLGKPIMQQATISDNSKIIDGVFDAQNGFINLGQESDNVNDTTKSI